MLTFPGEKTSRINMFLSTLEFFLTLVSYELLLMVARKKWTRTFLKSKTTIKKQGISISLFFCPKTSEWSSLNFRFEFDFDFLRYFFWPTTHKITLIWKRKIGSKEGHKGDAGGGGALGGCEEKTSLGNRLSTLLWHFYGKNRSWRGVDNCRRHRTPTIILKIFRYFLDFISMKEFPEALVGIRIFPCQNRDGFPCGLKLRATKSSLPLPDDPGKGGNDPKQKQWKQWKQPGSAIGFAKIFRSF